MAEGEFGERLKGFASSATAVTAILGFVVGLPSLVFTWSSQANERARVFSQAVDQEEARWNRLYELYYSALADREVNGRAAVAEARFQALCRLVIRPASDFHEFPLGWPIADHRSPQHIAASDRASEMRKGLVNMLSNPATASSAAVDCMEQRKGAVAAEASETRQRVEPAKPAVGASTDVPPSVSLAAQQQTKVEVALSAATAQQLDPLKQPGSVTLSAGKPAGYDLDVFWCEGAKASENLQRADVAARALAVDSVGGIPIGRVRLRILTVEQQAARGWGQLGNQVRGESDEDGQAKALVSALNGTADGPFRYFKSSQKTPWYISVFACQP